MQPVIKNQKTKKAFILNLSPKELNKIPGY